MLPGLNVWAVDFLFRLRGRLVSPVDPFALVPDNGQRQFGATLKDVSKTLCFLTDMDTFATFNEAYVEGFGGSRPARSTIGVAALPFGGAVEIEAWAYKPEAKSSVVKSSVVKSSVVKSSVAKKPAPKKPAAKKSSTRKIAVKKSAAKKSAKKSRKGR